MHMAQSKHQPTPHHSGLHADDSSVTASDGVGVGHPASGHDSLQQVDE